MNENGFIYILIIGYPIIIYLSIVINKEKKFGDIYFSENTNNFTEYLRQLKFIIKLVNSFFIQIKIIKL